MFSEPDITANMKRHVISGIGWTSAGRVVRELINLVVGIILARLLEPEAFGLIGMIFVFVQFSRLFSDLGFTGAVVQRKEVNDEQLSTIFWINLATGILITLILVLCAPLIARFYDEPRLVSLTIFTSLTIGIGSLNDLQTAILRRSMQFRRQTLINISSGLVSGVVAIGMALAGYGVCSLVAELMVGTVVNVLVMWFTTPWKPRFLFNFSAVRDILNFSLYLQGFKLSNFFVRNIDNLLVGKFLDVFALGIYRMAYKYTFMLNNLIVPMLQPVLIPALSRIQDEHERLRAIYIKINQVIAFITFPLAIGLIVTADTFVLSLLGEKWEQVIPLLRLFGIATIVLPILETRNWLTTVLGRGDILLRWQVFDGILSTALFFIGLQFGVRGVTAAFVIRTYLMLYPLIAVPGRIIGLSFVTYVLKLLPVLLSSALMGGLVWLVTALFLGDLPPVIALGIQVAVGGIAYLGLSLGLRIDALHDLVRLAREMQFGGRGITDQDGSEPAE
jgi:O-antigen/teichoic acid export membrane protein